MAAPQETLLVRLKPHNPKKGYVLKQYTYRGIRFQAGRGWYRVESTVAAYLASVRSIPDNEDTPLAFDVCTSDEAQALDERDRRAANQALPAEEALDVTRAPREHRGSASAYADDHRDEKRRRRRLASWEERYDLRHERVEDLDDDVEEEAPRPAARRVRRRHEDASGSVRRRRRAAEDSLDEAEQPRAVRRPVVEDELEDAGSPQPAPRRERRCDDEAVPQQATPEREDETRGEVPALDAPRRSVRGGDDDIPDDTPATYDPDEDSAEPSAADEQAAKLDVPTDVPDVPSEPSTASRPEAGPPDDDLDPPLDAEETRATDGEVDAAEESDPAFEANTRGSPSDHDADGPVPGLPDDDFDEAATPTPPRTQQRRRRTHRKHK